MFCRMDTEFEFDVTQIFDVVDFDCFSLHRIAFPTWPPSNFMRYVSLGEWSERQACPAGEGGGARELEVWERGVGEEKKINIDN